MSAAPTTSRTAGELAASGTDLPEIRAAHAGDAPEIVAIARAGVPREVLPFTVFAASGAAAFLADRIAADARDGRTEIVVAKQGGELHGFAGFGHVAGILFLNHVYVREGRQGGGIGARLLRAGIERSRRAGETILSLDVFPSSAVAMRWYGKIGLAPVSTADWRLARLPPPAHAPGWSVLGLAAADSTYASFGLAELVLAADAGARYPLGLLGGTYRTRSASLLADGRALSFLASLGRGGSIVCIAPEAELAAAGVLDRTTFVARSTRMTGSIEVVLERTR